ncbi:hypothetical protein GUJ93_ZPchr0004g39576 [Zizania palustris]|uniref:Uncharacterized protein n=1 Tax=Zizania palustris TaxID=103762 RepID=A0A8J5T0N3_ZIZPA|nr:hypothetical protein GUJ93_ZPchr0004g39576 [Zizania palustris]
MPAAQRHRGRHHVQATMSSPLGPASPPCALLPAMIFPHIKWYYILVTYVFAPVLSFCNAYGAGLTDCSLASTYGKLTISIFGACAGASHDGMLVGLAACGVIMSIVSTTSDLMQDFKTGYLTLASPRSMFISQVIGTAMGCVIAPCVFWFFYKAFSDIGVSDNQYPAPYAIVYRNMAILGADGFSTLPKHCLTYALLHLLRGRGSRAMQLLGNISDTPYRQCVITVNSFSLLLFFPDTASARLRPPPPRPPPASPTSRRLHPPPRPPAASARLHGLPPPPPASPTSRRLRRLHPPPRPPAASAASAASTRLARPVPRAAAMDVNEEAMVAHKRAFLDFLDQDVSPLVTAHFCRRLLQWFVTDFFGPCVCRSDTVTEVARNLDPKFFGPCVC